MESAILQLTLARRDITGAINAIQQKYNLSATVLDGLLCNALADVRNGVIAEVVSAADNEMLNYKMNDKKE